MRQPVSHTQAFVAIEAQHCHEQFPVYPIGCTKGQKQNHTKGLQSLSDISSEDRVMVTTDHLGHIVMYHTNPCTYA